MAETHTTARSSSAVRVLQAISHVLFVLLLMYACLALALGAPTWVIPRWLVWGSLGAILAWYVVGIWLARKSGTRSAAALWLSVLLALWILAAVSLPHARYLAFPLFLLALHTLGRRAGTAFVIGVTVLLIFIEMVQRPDPLPAIVGTILGAGVALAIAVGYNAVLAESRERGRLLAELLAANAELDCLHTELASTQRAAGAQAERARLARDIHDTLAQGFSSVILLSRAAQGSADPQALLAQIEETAVDNLAEARRVVADLAPEQLTEAPLAAALQRLTDRLAKQTLITTRLVVDGEVRPVPTAVDVTLLRFAQSALANVRLHAQARHVVVTLGYETDAISLDVVDDGVGFDPSAPRPAGGGGFGLRAMRERLAEVGGTVTIESAPGDGTAIVARIPLHTGGSA